MYIVAIPVTIGFRQRLYYVDEDAGSVVVCYDVLSGRTASRSIHMRLITFQEKAQGSLDALWMIISLVLID